MRFANVAEIVPGRTGISGLTDYWGAEVLVTRVNQATGECELSKPLPKGLKKGQEVRLMTLKYLPLHPVGTKEFDETAAGLGPVRPAGLQTGGDRRGSTTSTWRSGTNSPSAPTSSTSTTITTRLGRRVQDQGPPRTRAGTCGSLPGGPSRRSRRDTRRPGASGDSPTRPSSTSPSRDFRPGPTARAITPTARARATYPRDEDYRDQPALNLDGFTPTAEFRIPEGWAHTFVKTESLMRLLNPEARRKHPPGVGRFYHYMTEHGVAPEEAGVKDEAAAWRLKTLCAMRSYCFWLNKGIDVLHYFFGSRRQGDGDGPATAGSEPPSPRTRRSTRSPPRP